MIAPDRPEAVDPRHLPLVQAAGRARPGRALKEGLPVANYIAGGDGLDFRADLATLNLSDVPTVMVELGNMSNAADAGLLASRAARSRQRSTGSGFGRWALPRLKAQGVRMESCHDGNAALRGRCVDGVPVRHASELKTGARSSWSSPHGTR